MLVLGRQSGQEILLQLPGGEEITITVIRTDDYRTRIGIDAPQSINIYRKELIYGQAEDQNKKTA